MEIDLNNSEFYINRELSWIEFNSRVLEEAKDVNNPLFERCKFVSIFNSNYDEFFMVRVASIKDQVLAGYDKADASGLKPSVLLKEISKATKRLTNKLFTTYEKLIEELGENNIHILKHNEYNEKQTEFIEAYFDKMVYPVLTPMAVDSSRPFPFLANKRLNLGIYLKSSDKKSKKKRFAIVQVPGVLPSLVKIPSENKNEINVTRMSDIIISNLKKLFIGREIAECAEFRIIRNADLTLEEEDAEDLLKSIEKSLKERQWGRAVKLEYSNTMESSMLKMLKKELDLDDSELYRMNVPLDLSFLGKMSQFSDNSEFVYEKYIPQISERLLRGDIFREIRNGDIFLHHPYDSFSTVVDFIEKAAKDPNVLAIKQTLYRVSGNSPIIKALEAAAERGKQVMVLLEVKARFDEENNIHWAKRLELAGCHVIYGLVGLKTHSKVTMVVRRENNEIRRYMHFGTGNYNDITARLYTDMGLLTCDEKLGEDSSEFFNMLSGYIKHTKWNKLAAAPDGLREKFEYLIKREIENAKNGKKAVIIAKMNSLVDEDIIKLLYKASMVGVKIELIVRGICCLKSGIEGVSDNIRVRSIVGRYLEHSRIYYFENGGNKEIYLSSADWMPRNLNRRVEILFPIEDENIKKRIIDIIKVYISDNVKVRIQRNDGKYRRVISRAKRKLNAQKYFMEQTADFQYN